MSSFEEDIEGILREHEGDLKIALEAVATLRGHVKRDIAAARAEIETALRASLQKQVNDGTTESLRRLAESVAAANESFDRITVAKLADLTRDMESAKRSAARSLDAKEGALAERLAASDAAHAARVATVRAELVDLMETQRREFVKNSEAALAKVFERDVGTKPAGNIFSTFRGAWNPDALYAPGDTFTQGGSFYLVLKETRGQRPSRSLIKEGIFAILAQAGASGSTIAPPGGGSGPGGGGVAISAGTNSTSTGTVVLSNSNGVTFGMDTNGVVTASVNAGGGGGVALSAGTNSTSTGTVVFSNSNGLTFGMNTDGVVTGSHNGLTTQTNVAFSADASSTFQTLSFQDSNGVSFSNNAGAIRVTHGLQFTSATSAITSNAVNTSAARIQGVIGSNTTFTSGSVGLRDLNGISFQSTTGQSFQITHALQYTSNTSDITSNAVHTSAARIQGIIGSNTTFTSGSVGLRDLNGISFQSTTGQSFQITHALQYTSNTSDITSNALNTSASRVMNIVAATNNTGGGTASLSSNVSFSNANGATFYTSVGGAVALSYTVPSVPAQTNQTLGIYVTAQSTGQSSSSTYDARSLSFVPDGIISAGWSNGSFRVSATVAAQTNQTGGIYVTAQSTGQSSSSTYDLRTLSIVGDGIVSAGWSNSTFRISATQSNQAFSAGGGSSAFQTLGFSDNAYASWTNTNGSVALAELRGSFYAVSNTTQSSSGTQNLDAVTFAGAGVASVGVSNGSIVISVPTGGTVNQTGPNIGISTGGNTAGSTGTISTGNYILAGGNNITLSQSTGGAGSNATVTISGPNMYAAGMSNLGNTAGSSGTVSIRMVYVGTNGIQLSQSTDAAGSQATLSFAPQVLSYYANLPSLAGMVTGASAITQTSGSSVFLQPFTLPYPVSISYLRLIASYNDSAVGTAGTTSANATFSCARYTTFGAVIYSNGVGASSRSLQSVTSSSGGMTGLTQYGAGAQGSQYTITIQKTIPDRGAITSQYTTSYAVSSGSIVISSNSNTLFTGPRFLDIPMGVALTPGVYWLGIGASTSSASNSSHISFVGTNALAMSLAGVSNSNVSIGVLGAATSASDHQIIPGLGVWTTNASNWSTGSVGLNSISQVVSNPLLPFQFIRQA